MPLWEGEHLRCGGFDLEVVLIPGHTPGSIALLDEKKRLLISGDSVQSGTVYLFGQGRNLPAYRASLDKLAALSYRFDWVLPSHGEALIPASALRDVRKAPPPYRPDNCNRRNRQDPCPVSCTPPARRASCTKHKDSPPNKTRPKGFLWGGFFASIVLLAPLSDQGEAAGISVAEALAWASCCSSSWMVSSTINSALSRLLPCKAAMARSC